MKQATFRLHFILIVIFLQLVYTPIVLDASAKVHKILPTIKFDGKVKKNIPLGDGTLIIEHYKEQNNPFLINGLFAGDTIKNASMNINGSSLFGGDIKYSLISDKESGLYSVSFLILKGHVNGIDVEEFGPITLTNKYRHSRSGGFTKELCDTELKIKEGILSSVTLLNTDDKYIPNSGIEKVTYNVSLEYGDRFCVLNFIFTPIEVKYNNGLVLKINPYIGDNKYSLESEAGSYMSFSKFGEVMGATIMLNTKEKLTLLENDKYDFQRKKFRLEYADNTRYTGSLQSFEYSNFSLPMIINGLPKIEKFKASDFKPANGIIVYRISDELTQDEFINGEKRSVIEAREKKEKEERDRQWAEHEKLLDEKAAAEFNQWVSQFGQKVAQAIKNNTPYIGMPEKAFRKIRDYSLSDETGSQRVYVHYGKLYGPYNAYYDPNAIGRIVVCSDGKVVRITIL